MTKAYLKCISCGKEYDINEVRYRCDCGDLLDVVYNFDDMDIDRLKSVLEELEIPSFDFNGINEEEEFLVFGSFYTAESFLRNYKC